MAYKNGLIAEDGGIVTGSCIRVMGYMSTIRVDDSSLVLTNSADALSIGYSNKYGGAGTNCFFEVAGAHPNVSLSGNLSVQHASTIKFELPAEGYDEGVKPIMAEGDVSMGATSAIAFTGTAEIAANRREIGKSADYVLIENPSNKAFLSDDAVAAAQAELGEEDFRLFKRVVGGRNQLVLRVKGHPGTIIMVR